MWEISISGQAAACLYSLALGAILSAFYDIIRATRKTGADSYAAVFIGDMLFWLVSAVVFFLFLLAVTNGEMRGYVIFFSMIGFLIYRLTIGKVLFYIVCLILSLLSQIIKKLSNITDKICIVIVKWCHKLFGGITKIISYVWGYLKKLLKSAGGMLYTKKNKSKLEYDANE